MKNSDNLDFGLYFLLATTIQNAWEEELLGVLTNAIQKLCVGIKSCFGGTRGTTIAYKNMSFEMWGLFLLIWI